MYSEVLEMACLTNYFKSVSTEECIAASFQAIQLESDCV